MPETRMVEIYVCPTPGCTNYFASSTMAVQGGLEDKPNLEPSMRHDESFKPSDPTVTSHRIDCPNCRADGRTVQRVKLALRLVIEQTGDGELRYLGASRVAHAAA